MPSFAAARTFDAGFQPASVAVGDFNGDGKLDIAVVNQGSSPNYTNGSISILLGNGDGAYQTALNYRAGERPRSAAVGDFNDDGKLDLAVANSGHYDQPNATYINSSVSVLLGNGDGTYQAAVNYEAGEGPGSVAIGDFNSDGKPDLAVGNRFGTDVSVVLGNGDGSFQPTVNYYAGGGLTSIAVNDFNGDGRFDLVGVHFSSKVSVLLGRGDGTFEDALDSPVGSLLSSVAVGDFNRDGKSDLAVSSDSASGHVSVLMGNGDGSFQAPVSYGMASTRLGSVAVGEFNGDGKSDLAVANYNSYPGSVSVLLGKGDGTFEPNVEYTTGTYPSSVAVGDFNRDGKPDLAVSSDSVSGAVSVLLNTCGSDGMDLTIVRSNTTVTISWPLPSTGFVLESTVSLSPPDWQLAVEVPTTNNTRLEITVPLTQQGRYFRLRKP